VPKEKVEEKIWRRIIRKSVLSEQTHKVSKGSRQDFGRSVAFILYKKDLIEGWIETLERAVNDIIDLSKMEYQRQTADESDTSPSSDQLKRYQRLQEFFKTLRTSADSLHAECTATPGTCSWGLGLRPPIEERDVSAWDFITVIEMELRFLKPLVQDSFLVSHTSQQAIWELYARYAKDDQATHNYENHVRSLLLGRTAEATERISASDTVSCYQQDPPAQRTRSIGDLIEQDPAYFTREGWKGDRGIMVYGLVNWALLLWDSIWLSQLCCSGLHVETSKVTTDRILILEECNVTLPHQHHSGLRNLGVALAEMMLARRIRLAIYGAALQYEQFRNASWEKISVSSLVQDVWTQHSSTPLAEAIRFCLESDCNIAVKPFEPGYLLRCINHIYTP
jgi:hypothetical protein